MRNIVQNILFIFACSLGCRARVPDSHLKDDAGSFQSESEDHVLARFDVSGADGKDGAPGISYDTRPPFPGMVANDGGDGDKGEKGKPGRSVNFELGHRYESTHEAEVVITGWVQEPDGQLTGVNNSIPIGSHGYIFIDAHGGRGGKGGDAGRGQPGAEGYPGEDATKKTPATIGKQGGKGGEAGNPADGGDGGAGGEVTIRVNQSQLGVLMLVKGNLNPGVGGKPGRPAEGGKGGPGGPGGQGIKWMEEETYTDYEKDENGNRYPVLKRRIVEKERPAASDGAKGMRGERSKYRAKGGQPGHYGDLKIEVVDDAGNITTYSSPYDLVIESYEVVGEKEILEPDSKVYIRNLTVRNTGGMPLPANYTVRIYLTTDRWVLADGEDLEIRKALNPGETYTFSNQDLKFTLGDHVIKEPLKEAFSKEHGLTPLAQMESGIGRPFRDFKKRDMFHIRFPVQLTTIEALTSLAPGEATKIRFGVTNIGNEVFSYAAFHRTAVAQLTRAGTNIKPELIVFTGEDGNPFDLNHSALLSKLMGLKPGETRIIETQIGVLDSAELTPYQQMQIRASVDLQRPRSSDRSGESRTVDMRQFTITVAERYKHNPKAMFVLIANHKTTTQDVAEWRKAANYFGSELEVWDVSYYGFLDLARALNNDTNFFEQWRNKIVIMPNNNLEVAGTSQTHAFEFLARSQFQQALNRHNISIYSVGPEVVNGHSFLKNIFIPIYEGIEPVTHEGFGSFLKSIKSWSHYVARSGEMTGGAGPAHDVVTAITKSGVQPVHELHINRRTLLFHPSEQWLNAQAQQLQDRLNKGDPVRTWHVTAQFDHGDTEMKKWGFFKRRQVGSLIVRLANDMNSGSFAHLNVDEETLTRPGFINSSENKHGMFLAIDFKEIAARFIRMCAERVFARPGDNYIDRQLTEEEILEIGEELKNAILIKLFEEQAKARRGQVWGTRTSVKSHLSNLNYLVDLTMGYAISYESMQGSSAALNLMYQFIAELRYLARSARSFWDHLFLPVGYFKRSRVVSAELLLAADKISNRIFGEKKKWWEEMGLSFKDRDMFMRPLPTSKNGLARKQADLAILKIERELNQKSPGLAHFVGAQETAGITYDAQLLRQEDLVQSGEEYDEVLAANSRAGQRRADTEEAIVKQRGDLLLPACELLQQNVEQSQAQVQGTPRAQN